MNRQFSISAFIIGLLAVLWVASGYLGDNHLALTVTLTITAVYIAGALELRRFEANTQGLADALSAIPDDLAHLGEWLQQVPPALKNNVRLRIEGERVALPSPGLTPYLVGLLVLLGMLGTFLGMVVTLNGAVLALESTTDLHTIRAALAAPVKGLGVAFGTSVAGVATSAMLGLMSALCRRDRLRIGQRLDSRIAGVLRDFSLIHQRQETFKALQAQSQALPELVTTLQAMMSQMSEHNRQLGDHLLAGQQTFHQEAKALYTDLAQSVDQSLKASLRDSATVAAETIQPVVTATMNGIAGQTRDLHDKLFSTVQIRLDDVAGRFTQTLGAAGDTLNQAVARHEQTTETQHQHLQAALHSYADSFEQRSGKLLSSVEDLHTSLQNDAEQRNTALVAATRDTHQQLADTVTRQLDGVASRFDQAVGQVADNWRSAIEQQGAASDGLHKQLKTALTSFADTFAERANGVLLAVDRNQSTMHSEISTRHTELVAASRTEQSALTQLVATQLDGLAQRFDSAVSTVSDTWTRALANHEQASERLTKTLDKTQSGLINTFAERSSALLADLHCQQAAWQSEWSAGENQRQRAYNDALQALSERLETEWKNAGAATLTQQEQITRSLAETARDVVATTQTQAQTTIDQVTRLMQTAAEAPKAAAEVIGQLRHELSASISRDNNLLEERSRIMETLATLLDAINHASSEQRSAIDALVASSAEVLERVGGQFASKVDSESGKLVEVGSSIAGSAIEVASLGEAFATAVQLFAASSDKMMGALQRIEGGLAKSLTRSDEQLAYYVAQAREIIDLSIMSQKRMVDDLQRVASEA